MPSQAEHEESLINSGPDCTDAQADLGLNCLIQKPTDLDLHCLQRQGISGFSRTRVN